MSSKINMNTFRAFSVLLITILIHVDLSCAEIGVIPYDMVYKLVKVLGTENVVIYEKPATGHLIAAIVNQKGERRELSVSDDGIVQFIYNEEYFGKGNKIVTNAGAGAMHISTITHNFDFSKLIKNENGYPVSQFKEYWEQFNIIKVNVINNNKEVLDAFCSITFSSINNNDFSATLGDRTYRSDKNIILIKLNEQDFLNNMSIKFSDDDIKFK